MLFNCILSWYQPSENYITKRLRSAPVGWGLWAVGGGKGDLGLQRAKLHFELVRSFEWWVSWSFEVATQYHGWRRSFLSVHKILYYHFIMHSEQCLADNLWHYCRGFYVRLVHWAAKKDAPPFSSCYDFICFRARSLLNIRFNSVTRTVCLGLLSTYIFCCQLLCRRDIFFNGSNLADLYLIDFFSSFEPFFKSLHCFSSACVYCKTSIFQNSVIMSWNYKAFSRWRARRFCVVKKGRIFYILCSTCILGKRDETIRRKL